MSDCRLSPKTMRTLLLSSVSLEGCPAPVVDAPLRARAPAGILPLALVLLACGGYEGPATVTEPITDPAQVYAALTLDHGAINLSTVAPFNTIQLTATPRDGLGQPMIGLPAPTFRSSQPLRVRVSHDGRIEALQTGTGILVIAELRVGKDSVQRLDTARVNVTATAAPPILDRLELDPVSPETAAWGLEPSVSSILGPLLLFTGRFFAPRLAPRALDPAGNAIAGLVIDFESLDPAVVRWESSFSELNMLSLGQARMVAHTTAYGVTKADTVTFTVKLPLYQTITLHPATRTAGALEPSEIRLRSGGWVLWDNRSGQLADVTFDDPANVAEPTTECDALENPAVFGTNVVQRIYGGQFPCGSGNIPAFNDVDPMFNNANTVNFRIRQFPVPGVYTYRNTVTGGIGRVVVTDG